MERVKNSLSVFLGMVASVQEKKSTLASKYKTTPARFMVNEGRQFIFDDLTFEGTKRDGLTSVSKMPPKWRWQRKEPM